MLFKKKEEKVCTHCGAKIPKESQFCPKCGKPVNGVEKIVRQTFAGQVIKCPNCGKEINSYVVICPACGYELKAKSNGSSSIQEFTKKIVEYDAKIGTQKTGWAAWGTVKRVGWIILNIYLICIPLLIYNSKRNKNPKTNYEAEKKSYIENYVFPNDRESILDALVYVKNKLYSLTSHGINADDYRWAQIWVDKAGQLYQQAELLFPGDDIAKETFTKAESCFDQIKKAKTKRSIRIALIVIGVIVFSLLYSELDLLLQK